MLAPPLPPFDVDAGRIRPLRRDEYDRLVSLGVFADERVELIHGVIIRMPPHGPPHAAPIERLTRLLYQHLPPTVDLRVQLPLLAPDESEPQPDLAVVDHGDHDNAHPAAAHLIIEVADSSLAYDRRTKGPLYAAMAVAEYWIVDVAGRAIEVHREPATDHYAQVTTYRVGQSITLAAFPTVTLEVGAVVR